MLSTDIENMPFVRAISLLDYPGGLYMHMHLKIPVLTHTSLHFNNIPIKEQSQCLTRIEWLICGTMIPKNIYIYKH